MTVVEATFAFGIQRIVGTCSRYEKLCNGPSFRRLVATCYVIVSQRYEHCFMDLEEKLFAVRSSMFIAQLTAL
jgi:hypothetical protein